MEMWMRGREREEREKRGEESERRKEAGEVE